MKIRLQNGSFLKMSNQHCLVYNLQQDIWIFEWQLLIALELRVTYIPPGILVAGARTLEWFIDSKFHALHILGICQALKNVCINTTNCAPRNQEGRVGRLWKTLSKDEQEDLKVWLDVCKGKINPVVDFAVCFEREPIALRKTAAESLEAQYFDRTRDTRQELSTSPPRSSTVDFFIRARGKKARRTIWVVASQPNSPQTVKQILMGYISKHRKQMDMKEIRNNK